MFLLPSARKKFTAHWIMSQIRLNLSITHNWQMHKGLSHCVLPSVVVMRWWDYDMILFGLYYPGADHPCIPNAEMWWKENRRGSLHCKLCKLASPNKIIYGTALGVLNSRVQLVPIHSETCHVPGRVNKVSMLECCSQVNLCSHGQNCSPNWSHISKIRWSSHLSSLTDTLQWS